MPSQGISQVVLAEEALHHEGEHVSPTCVVVGGSSVDCRSPVALGEPLSPRPGLAGPATER